MHRELNRRPGATGRAEPGGRQGRTRLQGPLVCVLENIIETIDQFLEAVVDLLKTIQQLFGGGGD